VQAEIDERRKREKEEARILAAAAAAVAAREEEARRLVVKSGGKSGATKEMKLVTPKKDKKEENRRRERKKQENLARKRARRQERLVIKRNTFKANEDDEEDDDEEDFDYNLPSFSEFMDMLASAEDSSPEGPWAEWEGAIDGDALFEVTNALMTDPDVEKLVEDISNNPMVKFFGKFIDPQPMIDFTAHITGMTEEEVLEKAMKLQENMEESTAKRKSNENKELKR
jgi:hypothetical protein